MLSLLSLWVSLCVGTLLLLNYLVTPGVTWVLMNVWMMLWTVCLLLDRRWLTLNRVRGVTGRVDTGSLAGV